MLNMSKPENTLPVSDDNGVDMEKIKLMMGPLPNEGAPVPVKKGKKKAKDENNTPDTSLASAAEAANAALKATMPSLGDTSIERVDDDTVLDSEGNLVEAPAGELPALSEVIEPTEAEAGINSSAEAAAPELQDDPVTSEAVDEIIAAEGDALLKAEDDKLAGQVEKPQPREKGRFKNWLHSIWARPGVRWAILITVIMLLLAAGIVPVSRYFILNNVGVRSSLSLKVIDNGTLQPLKNVQISVAGVSGQTNSEGSVRLEHLKLGPATLTIGKRAFADQIKPLTVGWGSNPVGDFRLLAVGAQYKLVISDFLSGKPIEKAEASSGDGNAISDKDGKIVLTLDTAGKADADQLDIQISAINYRVETLKLAASNKEAQAVKLVPSRKHAFVSKRSGNYDVYTVDADGKNEKRVVSGTGLERSDISLVPDREGAYAALVATRENVHNADGYLLSTLYTVDLKNGTLSKVDQSEQVQLLGWSDDGRLAYVKIAAGASAANPKRNRLMSFNTKAGGDPKELYSTNYFNDVLMIGGKVYFAPSSDFQDPPKPGLYSVNIDGTAQATIYDKLVWNIFRTAYDTIHINASGTWFTNKLGTGVTTAASAISPTQARFYNDSPDGKTSLWVDERDGKGVLLSFDKASGKDTILLARAGVKTPLYWLSATDVVFRLSDGKETSDYVLNVAGGDPKKVSDVTDTKGTERWFYY